MTRSPTRGESSLGASVTLQDGRLRSSRASTRGREVGRREGHRTRPTDGRDFRGLSKERNHIVVSFAAVVCCTMERTPLGAQTGRRGGAGPVRGSLGGKDPPAVCFHGGRFFKPSSEWISP